MTQMVQTTEPRLSGFFRAFRVFRGPASDFVPLVPFVVAAPSLTLLASVVPPDFFTADFSDATDGQTTEPRVPWFFFRAFRVFRGPNSVSSVCSC